MRDERDGAARQRRRQPVVAPHADDLLDQIVFHRDVAAEARHGHLEVRAVRFHGQTETREDPHGLRPRRRHAEDALHPRHPEAHARGLAPAWIGVDDPARDRAAGQLGDERGRAGRRRRQPLDVGAALEAVRGGGSQRERARRAPDRGRVEPGALQQDAGRAVGHLGVGAAHHAGEPDRALGIGDEQHRLVERPLLPVERGEALADASASHDERPVGHRFRVVGVQRLAELPEHVVGRVHDVADRAQAHGAQPHPQPGRRGPDGDRADDAHREPMTEIRRLDLDPRETSRGLRRLAQRHRRRTEARAGERGELARDAEHRETIGPVRRDLDLEHVVVEAECRDQIGARTHAVVQQ